jgi:hypothetical protein
MKNCLASWLHSAETEAIACASKVIDGRIHDAPRHPFRGSNSSRALREMSETISRNGNLREDILLDACDNYPRPVMGGNQKSRLKGLLYGLPFGQAGGFIGDACLILAENWSVSPLRIIPSSVSGLFHRPFRIFPSSMRRDQVKVGT